MKDRKWFISYALDTTGTEELSTNLEKRTLLVKRRNLLEEEALKFVEENNINITIPKYGLVTCNDETQIEKLRECPAIRFIMEYKSWDQKLELL